MSDNNAISHNNDSQIISASRLIRVPAGELFSVLADASRHKDFDGSDTVQAPRSDGPVPLSLGTKFGMGMKIKFLPYRITNEVVEFEQDQSIAWKHFGGHIWRYELKATEGATMVTESFDWSTAAVPAMYRYLPQVKTHAESMRVTLERLEALFS